jgi:UDPglucose 6-dehydrogenase
LTFKPNTDDMRESPSLDIVPALQAAGAELKAYDPVGTEEAQKHLSDVAWCDDAYDAIRDADAVVLVTEWNEFRSLDLNRIKELMKQPVLVDLRNIYDPEEMTAAGFSYVCIGRGIKSPQEEESTARSVSA